MNEQDRIELEVGRVYTAEELATIFGFDPYYLRTAGGMVPVPQRQSLLLITHADQEASFEYGDYWDGEDLIYTGRGQDGDQVLSGPNLDVAENRRRLWLFERQEKYQRRYLGQATCARYWWGVAPDKNGVQRRVLRFCLRLQASQPTQRTSSNARRPPHRKPRPFDETAVPARPSAGTPSITSDEIVQLNEKATAAHHALLVALKRWLEANGWTNIEEIPAAVDLWASRGDLRIIFEAKTLTSDSELVQTRSAFAQLLEYRFFYGQQTDQLCLVADGALSDRRLRFLDAMGIHALWHDGEKFVPCGGSTERFLALTS
jgi:hypothetical protein